MFDEECHEEKAEHDAVKKGTDDVDRLDEVLGKSGEEREGDGDKSPDCSKPLGDAHVSGLVVGGERAELAPQVHGGGRTKCIELAGFGA